MLTKGSRQFDGDRDAEKILPCDVMVAPRTVIRRGCKLSTLLLAISRREGLPDGARVRIKFDAK